METGQQGNPGGIRLGLCCIFRAEPIKFRQVTAKTLRSMTRSEQLKRLSAICLANVYSLGQALRFAAANSIGAFRILSPLFPRYTHREVGYRLEELEDAELITGEAETIRIFRRERDIRLSFHPDQFNVLTSPRPEVVENTRRELEYQGMLADLAGAEIINLHGGGVYGDKKSALDRLRQRIDLLPDPVRERLTLENDDTSFTPEDLLPICERMGIPMVYDVHHHRCLPDGLSVEEATRETVALWERSGREPYFHISSPKYGWQSGTPKPHADYIDPADFPESWTDLRATVDVEAKAKELAVLRLQKNLEKINKSKNKISFP